MKTLEAVRPIRSLAIVTPFYPPHVGGVERYAQQFARAAADLGLAVNVVTTDAIRRPAESTDDRGVRVLRLPAYNLPVMGSTYPISLSGWHRAAELLRCDAVMAHTRFFMTTPIAAVLAARQNRRICVVDHGAGPLRSAPLFMTASLAYEHCITSVLKLFSPHFFAVSGASAQWLRRFGIHNARIIPNGIAPREIMPVRDSRSFDRTIVFYAGRLFAEKGILELVDAVAELRRHGTNIELRVAGHGPLSPLLEKRASTADSFAYLGRISADEVATELERATILVNPSNLQEGFSRILLEAGAAALPVISTPFGACGELIQEGATGWLVPRGESGFIASCLRKAIAQPDESIRRGAKLFRLVQEHYTWPSIVRAFLAYAETKAPYRSSHASLPVAVK